MSTLTIRLDDELDATLTRLAAESHRTKSELVREMLRRQAGAGRFRAGAAADRAAGRARRVSD